MSTTEERRLLKNSIELFILRFDLIQNIDIDFNLIISDISRLFDRTEKRMQTNFHVNFTTDKSEVSKQESYDYVLIKEKERYSITFSKNQNAFWFETSNYINNQTYTNVIIEVLNSAQKNKINLTTRRIGMRFVNNFYCATPKHISKVFTTDISKTIIQRLSQKSISRIIFQEEFNFDVCKVRVQYGIPNKFYPAVINNFDLLLDIDAYEDKIQELDSIYDTIVNLNHCAYNSFISNVNSNYLNTLR